LAPSRVARTEHRTAKRERQVLHSRHPRHRKSRLQQRKVQRWSGMAIPDRHAGGFGVWHGAPMTGDVAYQDLPNTQAATSIRLTVCMATAVGANVNGLRVTLSSAYVVFLLRSGRTWPGWHAASAHHLGLVNTRYRQSCLALGRAGPESATRP